MTKQEAKEQKRKAKKLARVLNEGRVEYLNSISVRGDGVMALLIAVRWNGKTYEAFGGAKCNRTDPWNESIAVEIATGRALLRIAYQILKDEESAAIDNLSIQEEVIEAIKNEYDNVTGVIFVKKGPGPRVMFDKGTRIHADHPNPKVVPGSAKYRGDQMQYGYGVIKPEYVPSGLEAIKKKEETNDRGDKAEGQPE